MFVILIEQVPPSLTETALAACSPGILFSSCLVVFEPGNTVKNMHIHTVHILCLEVDL